MAYYHKIKHKWLPDTVTASRELTKLRPCEHMIDEAWRICKICTSVWLCAMGVYANSREEMEDIEPLVRELHRLAEKFKHTDPDAVWPITLAAISITRLNTFTESAMAKMILKNQQVKQELEEAIRKL